MWKYFESAFLSPGCRLLPFFFPALLWLFLTTDCRRIHVPVPVSVKSAPVMHKPNGVLSGSLRPIQLVIEGEFVDRRDWVQAYAISRLFHRGVENETGTPAELLRQALQAPLERKGYRIMVGSTDSMLAGGDRPGVLPGVSILKIGLWRFRTAWFPPQEFIQTIRPHRRGRILMDFHLEATLPDGEKVILRRTVESEAYPGEEYARIESLTSMLLGEFAEDVLDRIRPAGELPQ